jgi:hypothetical protein
MQGQIGSTQEKV